MISVFHCKRCGGEWVSRQEHPKFCGVCKSAYWDRDYKSEATKEYGKRLRFNKMIIVNKLQVKR